MPSQSSLPVAASAGLSRQIQFRVTARDLTAAYRVQALAQLWRWRSLIIAAGAALVLMLLAETATPPPPPPVLVLIAVGAILGSLIVARLLVALVVPQRARRIYRQQRGLHGDVAASWDDTAFRVRVGESNSTTPWAHYIGWRENKAVLLLFHSDLLFQFIPKAALTPDQLEDLRACAASAEVKGARRN
jgi:hypothetical protein